MLHQSCKHLKDALYEVLSTSSHISKLHTPCASLHLCPQISEPHTSHTYLVQSIVCVLIDLKAAHIPHTVPLRDSAPHTSHTYLVQGIVCAPIGLRAAHIPHMPCARHCLCPHRSELHTSHTYLARGIVCALRDSTATHISHTVPQQVSHLNTHPTRTLYEALFVPS